jgi:glucose/arabinose dehydrogenase/lysophospholipase L1-like esterase
MVRMITPFLRAAALAAALACCAARAEVLTLNPGDHIALIGNGLADRMQHHGWLESLIYERFPKNDLVFRNLGFSGDEVGGYLNKPAKGEVAERNRSTNFGSEDEWLAKVKADVIFAFFGFNESFAGDAGLPAFRKDLETFVAETKAKNFSGKGAPRLVLFSPIACEKVADPNLPDPSAKNANLKKYSAVMAEVAKAGGVGFIDLLTPSSQLYAAAAKKGQALTLDTVHLTDAGDKAMAPEMFQALFNETAPQPNEKLRTAINDKNAEWHSRYRTVDGYNIYGKRSELAYQPGNGKFLQNIKDPEPPFVSNFHIMQEEMTQRDVMTANRDKRVWAVAQGGDLKVDDSNIPAVEKVKSNKPGPNPDGSYKFLSGEEAIQHMTLGKNLKVELVASEEQFPELVSPVQMAFDTKGRLWVAAWKNYPERTPDSTEGDKLLVFDLGADGKAKKMTTWLGDLNCPTGFQFYKEGVLVMQAPDLWYVKDKNGKGDLSTKERVLIGMDSADSHHTANSIVYEPGGAIYLSDGVFHRTQVESIDGPVRNTDGCIYRFEPSTFKFDRYVAYGFANPHGRVFDYWGTDIITDATGNASYFGPAFSGHVDFPGHHKSMKQFWVRPSRPCPGTGMISSRHFPEDYQGNFININVIGYQGMWRVKVSEDGSGIKGETMEDFVKSDDPNFRPSAISVAPDGSLYFLDWHKPLIGHMQHHLRDPNREHDHGRIYRITYADRPLLKPVKIDGESIDNLLNALKTPENDVRTRAKIELAKHDTGKVIAALDKWVGGLNPNDQDFQHQLTEALWVHQWLNVVDEPLLRKMLRAPDYHARAAATRVLCYWRDRVKDPLALLKIQVNDESPRVRIEAVRACSFFRTTDALDVAVEALNHAPLDYYLQYCLDETTGQLEKMAK